MELLFLYLKREYLRRMNNNNFMYFIKYINILVKLRVLSHALEYKRSKKDASPLWVCYGAVSYLKLDN